MTIEKLTGRTSGRHRGELVDFAIFAASDYFGICRDRLRIELSNVETLTIDGHAAADPNTLIITGYEGDFTAEVIDP